MPFHDPHPSEPTHKQFVEDMTRPGLLYGAVVWSAHARAKVLNIDTSQAQQLPGVVAVMTAADVPGERYQRDYPVFVAVGEDVRGVGDVLVTIAAEDLKTALEAVKFVSVEYDVLDPVDDLLRRSVILRGNAKDELAHSCHVARAVFLTRDIECREPELECALAELVPNGGLCVHSKGQDVHEKTRQIAAVLGWTEDRVIVRLAPNGGVFEATDDLTLQAHAALLAWKTGRPVKLSRDKEQVIRRQGKRHPMRLEYEVGCDVEGHLTAMRARILVDSQAYSSVDAHVLEMVAGHAAGAYAVSHVDVEARAAYTSHLPSGAMHGFGVSQVMFALESCIDELADLTGLDRWEIRYRNALRAGDAVATGQVLDESVGVVRCLRAVKPAWYEAKKSGHSVGIACGMKRAETIANYEFAVQLVVCNEAGRITRVIAAHDVGNVPNSAVYEGQIKTSVRLGLGYALTEEFANEIGMLKTLSASGVGDLQSRNTPKIEVILVEGKETERPVGVENIAEIGIAPTAAAVASALRAADGIMRRELPMQNSTAEPTMTVVAHHVRHRAPSLERVYVHRGIR